MVSGTLLKAILGALLLLALLTSKCAYDHNRRLEGRLGKQIRQADSTIAALRQSMRTTDQQYARDTTDLRTELARWQAMKQRVRIVIRDSLLPPDTVEGPERVVMRDSIRPPTLDEILRAADTTIQRCTTALSTCEVRIAQRDSTIKAVTWERDMWKRKSEPSFLTRLSTATKWVAVGFLIGELKR